MYEAHETAMRQDHPTSDPLDPPTNDDLLHGGSGWADTDDPIIEKPGPVVDPPDSGTDGPSGAGARAEGEVEAVGAGALGGAAIGGVVAGAPGALIGGLVGAAAGAAANTDAAANTNADRPVEDGEERIDPVR